MILHLVTDRGRLAGRDTPWPEQRRCLLAQARFAIDAGIAVIQLRERDLEAAVLYDLAVELVAMTAGSQTRIVVNDRVDVALAARAHGVHLRADSIAPAIVRRLAPTGFLVGRSVHAAVEAAALASDVDYMTAGTVWATASKPGHVRLLGLDGLAGVVAAAGRVPVLAIGGVRPDCVADLARVGAAGVAAIGLFIAGPSRADNPGGCGAMSLHELARRVAADATVGRPRPG